MSLPRKTFLSATICAVAAALTSCKKSETTENAASPEFYRVLGPNEYDVSGMIVKIRVPNLHKQVFAVSSFGIQPTANYAVLFNHMQLAMNGYDFSLKSNGKLATLGVLMGSAVAFSLNDAVWQKYEVGQLFHAANTNIYYRATSNLNPQTSPNDPKGLYQDWSAEAVLKRGGSFMVCHNAMTRFAANCSSRKGGSQAAVLSELLQNMLPGFMIVPAGVTAVQLAQENGWKVFQVT